MRERSHCVCFASVRRIPYNSNNTVLAYTFAGVRDCLEHAGTALLAVFCRQFHFQSQKIYANRRPESSGYNEFARCHPILDGKGM
jgi:hypothetical protein